MLATRGGGLHPLCTVCRESVSCPIRQDHAAALRKARGRPHHLAMLCCGPNMKPTKSASAQVPWEEAEPEPPADCSSEYRTAQNSASRESKVVLHPPSSDGPSMMACGQPQRGKNLDVLRLIKARALRWTADSTNLFRNPWRPRSRM